MQAANSGKFVDGIELFTCEWLPAEQPSGVVLCLHGVESHSQWFEEVAAHLTDKGLAVFAFDRPGWGRSPGERGHLPAYADALRQVVQVASELRERFGSVHLAGLSWGGLLAAYASLRRGALFDSVTMIAPGIYPTTDLSWFRKLTVAASILGRQDNRLVALPIDVSHFTRRRDRSDYILKDPHRTIAVSASFCLETLKMRKFVQEYVKLRRLPPTNLLLAGDDRIIDNAATRALFSSPSPGSRFQIPSSKFSGPSCHLETKPGTQNPELRTRNAEPWLMEYEAAAHSLVFEAPERVAADIADLAARSRPQPTGRRIVVMGAGAVGSAVGGLLALQGHEAILVGRRAHVAAVNERGLELQVGAGRRFIKDNLTAVTSPDQIKGAAELVILAVKSFDTETALAALKPVVARNTVILSLQNGTENEARIARAFPDNIVLGGAICAYLDFSAPGRVVWSNDRGGLAAGVFQGDPDRAEEIWNAILPGTGMEAKFVSGDAASRSVKWSKLMLNVAFNALNAATGLPTAEILGHPEYGLLAAQALKEGLAVMRGAGIAPVDLPGYPVTRLEKLCRLPAGLVRRVLAWQTAKDTQTVSSMAQDLRRGRGLTEIDEINGAVARAGASGGVKTPANEKLAALVRKAAGSGQSGNVEYQNK